jgi:hypothetical protein
LKENQILQPHGSVRFDMEKEDNYLLKGKDVPVKDHAGP